MSPEKNKKAYRQSKLSKTKDKNAKMYNSTITQ